MKTIHIIYYIPIPRNKTEIVSKATYIPKPQTMDNSLHHIF